MHEVFASEQQYTIAYEVFVSLPDDREVRAGVDETAVASGHGGRDGVVSPQDVDTEGQPTVGAHHSAVDNRI